MFGSRSGLFALFTVVALICTSCVSAPPMESGTKVVLLGTGSPVPDPQRSGPCLAVIVNGKSYLVDCGTGCVRQAAKAYHRDGFKSLSVFGLNLVFITHLHSDHTLGYPDLILTPWDHRKKPLEVYGPVGTKAMTDNLLKAYDEDIKVRTTGLQKVSLKTLIPDVHEIKAGVIYKDDQVTVTAFPVKHGTFPNSYGFKFVTPDKTIVISGDTSPTDVVAEQAKGADMLIHEVYSMVKYNSVPADTQKYLKAFHTSTQELAKIAAKAKPKLLVPMHMLGNKDLPAGSIEKELRQAGYKGKLVESHDLCVLGD